MIKNKRSISSEIKQYKDAMKDLKDILIKNELQKRADLYGITDEDILRDAQLNPSVLQSEEN